MFIAISALILSLFSTSLEPGTIKGSYGSEHSTKTAAGLASNYKHSGSALKQQAQGWD